MIIDCIADLHGHYPKLEGGDLLIVAGDLTARDTQEEYLIFGNWIQQQNYKTKIVVCGNHDSRIEKIHENCKIPDDLGLPRMFINPFMLFCVEYLCDSGTEFEYEIPVLDISGDTDVINFETRKFKIWGSPWTKRFEGMDPKCMAFTVDTEEELAEKWALIPSDTDILVTHCPPFGILDEAADYLSGKIRSIGSVTLSSKYLVPGFCLKLHVFGHIHEHGGKSTRLMKGGKEPSTFLVNASHVNERYEPVNKPIRIEL